MQTKAHRLKLMLLTLILATLVLAVSGCNQGSVSGSSSSGNGEMAARVGSTDIPLSKIDRLIEQGLQGQTDKKISDLTPVELAAARLQALDTLITDEVLFQRARQENIQVSDEDVRGAIQAEIQNNGLSADDFQKKLKDAGLTQEEFNEEQRRRMMVGKLQDKLTSNIKTPTDREISDYYGRNPNQFMIGRGVNLSMIVVDAANNQAKNDAIGEEQAKQKIDGIYNQLKGGADFATVARIQSEDQTAIKGGDMGFLDERALQQLGFPPQMSKGFFDMREGDITPVIPLQNGRFVIFKLTAKRTQEEKLTLDSPQVKAQISQLLTGQRKEILNSALLSAALHQSRIENYLAQRMLQNPDNFGSLRPTNVSTNSSEPAKPAATSEPVKSSEPAKTGETKSDASKSDKDSSKPAQAGK